MYINNSVYQLDRWGPFLDPWADALDKGYQTVQGLMALGLGGTFGQGLGHSQQPGGLDLPNAQNDFVFAMLGQELGLVGGALVIGLFLLLAWRGIRVGMRARTRSARCWPSASAPGSHSRRSSTSAWWSSCCR